MARLKTNEEYYQEVALINPDIIVTGKYNNASAKMTCECPICGYKWITTARNLLKPKKCLHCNRDKYTVNYPYVSDKEFKRIIKSNYPNIEVTGEYHVGLPLITCKCNQDDYVCRARVSKLLNNTYSCPICENGSENIRLGVNDIFSSNMVLWEMLANKDDADIFSINSRARVDFICPSCNSIIKNKTISKVNRFGLKCKCSDGNSLGEKYFHYVINSVSDNVEAEKYLDGNKKYRYDFYGIQNGVQWIVEIQGKQHTQKSFHTLGGRTLEEEIKNDIDKRNYAISCGVDLYIEIDSQESGLHQLKKAILNSELSSIFDFSNTDWVDCYRRSFISDINTTCELWNDGYSIGEIANELKLDRHTVSRYLSKANSVGLCQYDHTKRFSRSVVCINTNEIFSSLREAERKYGISRGYLSGYLKGRITLPVGILNNEKLIWKYVK